tara:strand:- start:226 stop:441 length:216 start_codon:yes stop_codon:yes gene_type:complete
VKSPRKFFRLKSVEAYVVFLSGFLLPLMFIYALIFHPESVDFMGFIEWLGVILIPILTYICARLIDYEEKS